MHGRVFWPFLRQSGTALCVFAGSRGSLHVDAVRSLNLTSAKTVQASRMAFMTVAGRRRRTRVRSKHILQPPSLAQSMRHGFEPLAPLARARKACLLGLRTGRGSGAFWLTGACMCWVMSVQMSGLRPAHTSDLPDNLKYSKWDHIEVSDDEGDSHPNIDQKLMARLKKEKRQRDYEEFRCCARQKLDAAWQRRASCRRMRKQTILKEKVIQKTLSQTAPHPLAAQAKTPRRA